MVSNIKVAESIDGKNFIRAAALGFLDLVRHVLYLGEAVFRRLLPFLR